MRAQRLGAAGQGRWRVAHEHEDELGLDRCTEPDCRRERVHRLVGVVEPYQERCHATTSSACAVVLAAKVSTGWNSMICSPIAAGSSSSSSASAGSHLPLAAHEDEDGTDHEQHRADPHRVPAADHERVACRGGEGVAARAELLRDRDRRGRSLVGRGARRGRESLQVAVDVAAVAGVERAAEDRDAERGAELAGGVVDGRRDALLGARERADDRVRRGRHRERGAAADDQQRDEELPVARARGHRRDDDEPDRTDQRDRAAPMIRCP